MEKDKNIPDSYDHEKISKGFQLLSEFRKPFQQLKFSTIPGREDNLMYRNLEKKEVIPDNVSFSDYLPHNIKHSPKKKPHSHSTVTEKFNLRRLTFDTSQDLIRDKNFKDLEITKIED